MNRAPLWRFVTTLRAAAIADAPAPHYAANFSFPLGYRQFGAETLHLIPVL
jgi:hypothetical protein